MSDLNALSQEEMLRWLHAQQGEVGFWKDWMATSADRSDATWLSYVLRYFELQDQQDFGAETLLDLGSGPVGILTRFKARERIAVDPLQFESIDQTLTRVKMPAEATGLQAHIADRVFFYNLLQHVISPKHVLAEALRLLKPTGTIYILEQLNLPTDNEHPHSLKLEWFDDWVQASGLHVKKRTLQQDMILDSQNPSQPGTGYCVLCLIVTPIAA